LIITLLLTGTSQWIENGWPSRSFAFSQTAGSLDDKFPVGSKYSTGAKSVVMKELPLAAPGLKEYLKGEGP